MLQDRLELSERRASRVTGQHRSTQRRLPTRGRGDDALRTELHAFSRGHPRWGYRRAWATLREEGWGVNRKRVQRLWRGEGLGVTSRVLKKSSGTVSARNRLRAATKKPFVFKGFSERRSASKRSVSRLQGFFITLLDSGSLPMPL